MANKPNQFLTKLGDPNTPLSHRTKQLDDVLAGYLNGTAEYEEIVQQVFERLKTAAASDTVKKHQEQLNALLQQLETAPMRPATFIQANDLSGNGLLHAHVLMESGEPAYVAVPDQAQLKQLTIGDQVLIDATMKVLLHPSLNGLYGGPEARFERRIDGKHIEVVTHQDEKVVVYTPPKLAKEISSGKVKSGQSVVLAAGGRIASCALPEPEDKVNHYRFLDRGGIPDVIVERDIGNPRPVIAQIARHIREEMLRPELRRKYRLRPSRFYLFSGVSGCGKTLHVNAIHRLMYEIVAEVIGAKLDELPPCVFRFKPSKLFSMWFGESDKNCDRVFDEIEQHASTPWEHNGREWHLPTLVVIEEVDGLGRARGSEGNDVYDRVMTTILQRLDPNREGLSDRLVIFLSTTNEPHIVDPAMLRRIGGSVETFGRLDQKAFNEILSKHICGLPADPNKGWKGIVAEVDDWLYGGKDHPIVELQYQGYSGTDPKFRRHFLTGALIDRAVQTAAEKAWEMAIGGDDDSGIRGESLAHSLNRQVQSVAHQLTPQNADRYLDLPEGARVTSIKRVQPPAPAKAEASK